MDKRRLYGLLMFSLMASFLFLSIVGAQTPPGPTPDPSGDAYESVSRFVEKPVIRPLVGVLFGVWNIDDVQELTLADKDLSVGQWLNITQIGAVVIYLLTWVIFLIVFKDLLEIGSPLSMSANWILAVGLVIIASQLNVVIKVATFAAGLAALTAAISVWLFIIVILFGIATAAVGGTLLQRVALNMRMARVANRSRAGATEVGVAISGLKDVERKLAGGRHGV